MSVTTGSTSQEAAPGVTLSSRYLTVPIDGTPRHFHYVWLRDNCWCTQCKVAQSGDRRLFTADIPSDIQPTDAARKSTRLKSSHVSISYAVFCLKQQPLARP